MRKDLIRRELTLEVVVGAFVFTALLALACFTIILGGGKFLKEEHHYVIQFTDVMGLRKGDSIVVRGMPVGSVADLVLTNSRVQVHASLENPLILKKDYRVTVVATSILGGRHMLIEEGSPSADLLPEGAAIIGTTPHDIVTDAAALVHDIRQALLGGKLLEKLNQSASDMREITRKINEGEGTIGQLINNRTAHDEIVQAASNLNILARNINNGQGTLGKLLTQDTIYKDLQEISDNMKTVTGRLAAGKGTMGRLLSEDDKVYKDLADSIASLKTVLERLEKGEGTMGRLLRDDELYNDLKAVIKDARATVDDFRETSPIVTFTSILFGAF